MSTLIRPPFRADHVGSFLRPREVLDARAQFATKKITAAQLRVVEDKAVRDIVKFQEDLGLQAITDGEFRRQWFHIDFLERLQGVEMRGGVSISFRTPTGTIDTAPPVLAITGKVKHTQPIELDNFKFLKSVTKGVPKITIPSPTMLHFRGGRNAIDKSAYPDLAQFYEDVATAYGAELKALGDAGCTYVQMDDTNLAYLCDPKMREGARARGDDPNELPRMYARWVNDAIANRPAGMTVCIHLCRGNFQSAWVAEGGYEPVAEALLAEMKVDGYFLEYDDERSGGFAPLRFVPNGKIVVLGLVSTKLGQMETKDELKRRIDEAAKYVPLEQLALSPQCGFSSTVHGNQIAVENQAQKLRLVIDVAREVWGG